MRILFLTWKDIKHPHKGGAEQVMLEYARGLASQGHQVTWFASAFAGADLEEKYEGIRIIRQYSNHTIWLFAWLWYRNYKKTNPVDIILDEAGGWPLLSPFFEKNIPIYFFIHHIGEKEFSAYPFPVSTLSRWIYRILIGLYKNVKTVTVSNSTRNELVQDFGFYAKNISVIHNTTEMPSIDVIPFEGRSNNILFFGRITPIKRVDHAILAFSSVLKQLPMDAELHIIGNAQDTKYVTKLEKLVQDGDLKKRVIFLGKISQDILSRVLASYKVLIVPSEKEGYGLVVIEGNAHGLPVIGYDVAGLCDSILPGINGVLVPNGDFQAIGQELVHMFANPEYYRTLSERSLKYVSTIPKWKDQVKKLENIITQK